MAEGKNQHYVPQRYFRMFSQDGKSIRALKLSDGVIIPSASIKGQASKAWFYGDKDIESRLAQLESLTGKSLLEIVNCSDVNQLTYDTLENFRIWLAVQRTRTESSRQSTKKTDTEMLRMWVTAQINSNPDLSKEEKEKLNSATPLIDSVDSTFQLQRMRIAAEQCGELSDLKLVLIKNTSNKPFLFGDAPCIYYNLLRHNINYKGVLGMKSLGLMIIFPLNEKIMAILYDSLSYNVRQAASGIRTTSLASDITSLNLLQFQAASNCIYYSNKADDDYVKYLYEIAKKSNVKKENISRESGLRPNSDGTSSSFWMTYEPQLPLKLSLSFLSAKEIEFPDEINTREDYLQYIR